MPASLAVITHSGTVMTTSFENVLTDAQKLANVVMAETHNGNSSDNKTSDVNSISNITQDPNLPKNIYDSLQEAPQYDEDFIPRRGGGTKTSHEIDYGELEENLKKVSPGNWVKVYWDGELNGEPVSLHYFYNEDTKQVFNVKFVDDWSN